MRSALLLMFIANSLLAVSSLRLAVRAGQALEQPPVKQPPPTMTFLDPRTGTEKLGNQEVPSNFVRQINEALNMKGVVWVYRGSYEPEGDRLWVYLKLTGGPHCPLHAPCFAWRAQGRSIPLKAKTMPTHFAAMVDYIGITAGLPDHDGIAACKGVYPLRARDHALTKKEWQDIRTESNKEHRIPGVPRTGAVESTEPFLAVPTVTFIDIENGRPWKILENPPSSLQKVMTPYINEMLNLAGKTVTYEGKPKSAGKLGPFYFKFFGGDARCLSKTAASSCYGWIEEGSYVIPGTTGVHKHTYHMGIGKPISTVPTQGKGLALIGSYPEINPLMGRPADGPIAQEWDEFICTLPLAGLSSG
ncbi:hypothetical protein BDP27DRAFT_1429929 [Rhodocollybia butyracea]|uniref:Uncharacterized protein n=1 Tax=Rhodocollybia butyracea TaxID=206335 RepID=A0A9P5PBT1_9AGAR|nr:hypothetical protein BDP27DRAFT_1429929 [Rhodocollybia butyracea]